MSSLNKLQKLLYQYNATLSADKGPNDVETRWVLRSAVPGEELFCAFHCNPHNAETEADFIDCYVAPALYAMQTAREADNA
jgi:hypothetical protein